MDSISKKSFCAICTNREYSLKSGMVCGLTSSLPEFNNKCPDYSFDKIELQKKKKIFNIETREKYHVSKIGSFLADQPRFIDKNEINKSPVKYPNKGVGKIFKTKKFSIKQSIMYSIFIIGLLTFGNTDWSLKSPNIIAIIIFSILSISYIIYQTHNDKIYVLSINENYINFNGLKIPWNSIIDFGLISGKNEHKLIICTLLNGNVKIDLNLVNITSSELINIIRENRKTFYNNNI